VTVEIDEYSADLSLFRFVAAREVGRGERCGRVSRGARAIRRSRSRPFSQRALCSRPFPRPAVEILREADNNTVWKLVSVEVAKILGLKSHTR